MAMGMVLQRGGEVKSPQHFLLDVMHMRFLHLSVNFSPPGLLPHSHLKFHADLMECNCQYIHLATKLLGEKK